MERFPENSSQRSFNEMSRYNLLKELEKFGLTKVLSKGIAKQLNIKADDGGLIVNLESMTNDELAEALRLLQERKS